jgi:hypothetical protein
MDPAPDYGDSKLLWNVGQYLQTARRNVMDNSHLYTDRREN